VEVVVCVIRRAESIGEGQQGRSGNVWVLVLVYDYVILSFVFALSLHACMHIKYCRHPSFGCFYFQSFASDLKERNRRVQG
jgi:hypothetical protein